MQDADFQPAVCMYYKFPVKQITEKVDNYQERCLFMMIQYVAIFVKGQNSKEMNC